MAIVNFVPDPTSTPGTGWFTNDKGKTIFTTDLETAKSLAPAPDAEADEPAPPGTRISYAGDASSPYANAVASNEGATGSAAVGAQPATPEAAVAKAGAVVPAEGNASAAAAPVVRAKPTDAVHAAMGKLASAGLLPSQSGVPKTSVETKTSTTTVQGRKAENVEKQIGTDRAALDKLEQGNLETAKAADERNLAAQDQRIASKEGQQTQLKEDEMQYAADKRAADARVQQFMDLPDGKVDPDRFMNNLSTGSKIGMTVLAMLSGGFASLQGQNGRNPFIDELDKRIEADINVQKDQIAQGRLRKSNLIARAEAQGATAQQAQTAARAQLYSLAADIGELQAQRLGLQGAQLQQAKQQIQALRYQAGIHEGELRASEENRIQTTREQENKAATGLDPTKLAEMQAKAWENYNKAVDGGQKPETAYAESGLAALGISRPTGAPKRSTDEAKASAVVTSAAPYAKKLGLVEDPNHPGHFVAPKGQEEDTPADSAMKRFGNFVGSAAASGLDPQSQSKFEARRAHAREVKDARQQFAAALAGATGMKLDDAHELLEGKTLGEIADSMNTLIDTYGEHRGAAERNTPAPGVSALGFAPVAAK